MRAFCWSFSVMKSNSAGGFVRRSIPGPSVSLTALLVPKPPHGIYYKQVLLKQRMLTLRPSSWHGILRSSMAGKKSPKGKKSWSKAAPFVRADKQDITDENLIQRKEYEFQVDVEVGCCFCRGCCCCCCCFCLLLLFLFVLFLVVLYLF